MPRRTPMPAFRLRLSILAVMLGATDGSYLMGGEAQARIPAPGLSPLQGVLVSRLTFVLYLPLSPHGGLLCSSCLQFAIFDKGMSLLCMPVKGSLGPELSAHLPPSPTSSAPALTEHPLPCPTVFTAIRIPLPAFRLRFSVLAVMLGAADGGYPMGGGNPSQGPRS